MRQGPIRASLAVRFGVSPSPPSQEGSTIATAKKPKAASAAGAAPSARSKSAAPKGKAPKVKAAKSAAPKAKAPKAKSPAAKKAAARPVRTDPLKPPGEVDKLHRLILKSLSDDKAEDVVSISLAGKSSVADYIVVASGRSSRQVGAIAEHLVQRVAAATGRKARVEGKGVGDWVLIDVGDVIVHVFRPEIRGIYKLEKMWGAEIPEA